MPRLKASKPTKVDVPATEKVEVGPPEVSTTDDEIRPLYTAIAEACGELEPQHLPGCCEKNCISKMSENMEEEGGREPDAPICLAAQVGQPYRKVRLGKLLCSILRHRAGHMGIPVTKDGYVPLEQLMRHPVMDTYNMKEVLQLEREDEKKRYKIVRDRHNKLHIRAQNGHSQSMPVDIKFKEVTADELPQFVAHGTVRSSISSILERGLSSAMRHYIHLLEEVPEPGSRLEGGRRENTAVIILDVKSAVDCGTKFYRAENGVLMAKRRHGKLDRNKIPATAIVEVRHHPSGERVYPSEDGKTYEERFGHFDAEEDRPVFPEELKTPKPIAEPRKVETGKVDDYPQEDVIYEDHSDDSELPHYYRCVKTTTGKSYLVRAYLPGMETSVKFLLDTGANMNIIPMDIFTRIPDSRRPKLEPSKYNIEVGDGREMIVKGIASMKIKIGNENYEAKFYITNLGAQAVMGTSFMTDYAVKISLGEPPMCTIRGERVPLIVSGDVTQRVCVMNAVTIQPHQEALVTVRVKDPGGCAASELFEPTITLRRKHGVVAPGMLVDVQENPFTVRVYNPNAQSAHLHEQTCIGTLKPCEEVRPVNSCHQVLKDWGMSERLPENERKVSPGKEGSPTVAQVDHKLRNSTAGPIVPSALQTINEDEQLEQKQTCSEPEMQSLDENGVWTHITELYKRSVAGIPQEFHGEIKQLLNEYEDIFAKNSGDIGRTNLIVHDIYTGQSAPVHQRARRISPEEHEAMKKTVENLHSVGIIEPSRSEWASNVRMVRKKDGTWRMCVDYRDLNDKTKIRDPYPLPRIDAMLDNLAGAKMFSSLDLIWGYHQVPLTEEAKLRTAFITPHMSPSHWQYIYMPFGLRDAPATFQRLVDKMLTSVQYDYVMAYLDDIIVKGDDVASSLRNLREVFERVRGAGLKLKPSKCELFREEIAYLGHIINKEGLKTDPKKIEAVKNWPIPIYLTDVRGFIGLCSYYRRFIKNFGEKVKPLSQLTCRTSDHVWREEHTEAFNEMKQALTSSPLLAHPREGCEYILDTDASTWAIGAVLSQMQPNSAGVMEERPIAYASRLLLPRELNYCTRKRELLAIYEWIQYFQHYLAGQKFTVRTDHDSLKGIQSLAKVPSQFARWIDYLNAFTFNIKVRQGKLHENADFLSRLFADCFCKNREVFERTESARDALRNEPVIDWEMFEKCAREVAARRIRCPREEIIKVDDEGALKNLSEHDLKDQVELATKIEKFEHERLRQRATQALKGSRENAHERPRLNRHQIPQTTLTIDAHWTLDEIKQAQQEDEDLALIYKHKRDNLGKPTQIQVSGLSAGGKTYARDWSMIELKNGLLYRYYEDATRSEAYWRLLIPACFQQEIIEKLHQHGMACHQGYQRTLTNIKLRYDWYDIRNQLRVYTRACGVCQRKRTKNVNTRHHATGHLPGYRGERVNMDVCGPFVVTPLKNKYLLVICDSFTRYAAAVPVADTRATTLADAFLRGWCNTFGFPTEVHTDHGTYFTSEFWKDMCSKLNMKHTLGSALRPQSNGQNERVIRSVQESLRVSIDGHKKTDWDVRASYATAAYNFTPNSTTKFTPHELMFGELPQMEVDFLFPKDEPPRTTPAEFLQNLLQKMKETFKKVRQNLRKAMELRKERHDKKVRTVTYKVGGAVSLKCAKKLVGNDKLADRYEGPYYILSIWDNGTLRLQLSAKSKPQLIHADRVEPWTQDPNLPTPPWVELAVKKYAPERQEVGVQVSLDLFEGEVVAVRSAPALNFSLTPTKPRETAVVICGICDKPELDSDGVLRSFSRYGHCHICRATPKWCPRLQYEKWRRDIWFLRQRQHDKWNPQQWID